jgi:hypothetical protein
MDAVQFLDMGIDRVCTMYLSNWCEAVLHASTCDWPWTKTAGVNRMREVLTIVEAGKLEPRG